MTRRLPSLNALRAFESAGRHLSFSRAADELFVTQGAISRQVKSLEDAVGVKLFRRLTRAIELTPQGREFLPNVSEAFDRLEQATIRLGNRHAHRILTVSVLPTFAMRWLIPRLPNFVAKHPGIEVRMITSIRPVNFLREDVDLAIRVGLPPDADATGDAPRISLQMTEDWTSVRAWRLMPDVLVPVCSPLLLQRYAPIKTPADLQRLPLLHMASRAHAWPDWFRSAGVTFRESGEEASYGHFFLVLEEALHGNGVALVPYPLAEGDIASGRLVVPVDYHIESAGAYHVLCRAHQAEAEAIKTFREWLMSERDRQGCVPVAATVGAGSDG